ncbi:E3 SUMO-protein ligase ZBED1-like [Haplochromis burtoni]|uniref:E3 SUMO-protein ligase ZBED1-like n=1 Tax=Haplochromis burtoni TaxID=8153 RepID=UPI001C2CC6B2|nr:E3 SUMO-protein ligase ZBED1-like [Haplochromis burtoni]
MKRVNQNWSVKTVQLWWCGSGLVFVHQIPTKAQFFCRTCKRAVMAKGGNTTNIFYHLKQKHFLEYKKAIKAREELCASTSEVVRPKKMTQQTIDVALNRCTPYDKSNKLWGEITDAVTHCLARDMMPIQSVEREGFKKMLETFDPRYKLPAKKYFSKVALPALYEEIRTEVSNALSSVEFFASTTDTWSSRTSDPYMSLTIHYVDKDWQLQNKCLETSFFPEDHTGETIARVLKEFLSSWNLQEEKQVCVTTDNEANIVKAVALNNWTRLSCFGHCLHICNRKKCEGSKDRTSSWSGKEDCCCFWPELEAPASSAGCPKGTGPTRTQTHN